MSGDVVAQWRREVAPTLPQPWLVHSGTQDTTVRVTAEELAGINQALEGLLAPYVRRADPPAGARAVRMVRHVLPGGRLMMLELLRRNRRYARLWGGETVSMLGDQVTGLALPLIAIMLLHAPAWQLGVLTAASWLPYVVALPVGSIVDGLPSKRLVLMGADLVRGAALATIPLAFVLDRLTTVHLLVVATVVGSAGVVSQTAYASFFPRVVAWTTS